MIQFAFGIHFHNVFDVITEGKYNMSLRKYSSKRKGTARVIGSNKQCYEFKTETVRYQNTNIYYLEK